MRQMFAIEVEITEADLIPPYNHVHHAQALTYLEESRVAFLQHIGFPLDQFLRQGLFLVVTALEARYKRELGAGTYLVTCEEPAVDRKTASLVQRVINAKGKTAIEGHVSFMCLSSEAKRAIALPEDFVAAFRHPRGESPVVTYGGTPIRLRLPS